MTITYEGEFVTGAKLVAITLVNCEPEAESKRREDGRGASSLSSISASLDRHVAAFLAATFFFATGFAQFG